MTDVKSLFNHDRCCIVVDWCYVYYGIGLMLCPLADVIANWVIIGDFRVDVITLVLIMADVIAMWQIEYPLGELMLLCLADVIATGWITLTLVLSCSTEPHPICVADGICLCFSV